MSFAGNFSSVEPTEQKTFSVDAVNQIVSGDTITSVVATLNVIGGASAASLLQSSVRISGTVVSQTIGPGFVNGTWYELTFTITTAESGNPIVINAYIPCKQT